MLLPTIKIKGQEDLGKAVDQVMKLIETVDNPRERRDLTFAMATLSRLGSHCLAVVASSAGSEMARAATADAYVSQAAKDAAKTLGYEMREKIK